MKRIITVVLVLTYTFVVFAQDDHESRSEYIEKLIVEKINRMRDTYNLSPLSTDDTLRQLALQHSMDMAERNYFDHMSPEGDFAVDRAAAVGIEMKEVRPGQFIGVGENIGKIPVGNIEYKGQSTPFTPESAAQIMVSMWMDSRGHRKNILNEDYTSTAVAVVLDHEGKYFYVTEVFF